MLNKWHIISMFIIASSLYAQDEHQLIMQHRLQQSVNASRCSQILNKPLCCSSRKGTGIAYFLSGLTSTSTMMGGIFSISQDMPLPISLTLISLGAIGSAFFYAGAIRQRCGQYAEEDNSSGSESDDV